MRRFTKACRLRERRLAGTLAVGLAAAGEAEAAGVRLSGDHAPPGDPGITVRSADVRGHQLLRLDMLAEYSREPLVTTTRTLELDRVVKEQVFVHARASYPLWHRLLLALDVPVLVSGAGGEVPSVASGADRPPGGSAFGDVAATGRLTAIGPAGNGFKGGAEAKVWLPTGSAAAYAGDDAPSVLGAAVVSLVSGRAHWSAETSVSYRRPAEIPGVLPLRIGPAVGIGSGAYFVVDAGSVVRAGAEVAAHSGFSSGARLLDPRSSQLELLAGARIRPLRDPLEIGVFGGPGIGQRPGSADYRLIASLAWSPERSPPPPDRDLDGVADGHDACPELPGVRSGDQAMNGCPDVPRDDDGDSIPDAFDACPREPGEPTAIRATHGCPPREPPRTAIVAQRIEISEHVRFATGTAELEARSERVLAEVAKVLLAHPEIVRLEVQGHTDDTGTEAFNRRLSQARAERVVQGLVARGVDPARIVARGYGTTKPLGDGSTNEVRARQRRVEFVILETAGGAK